MAINPNVDFVAGAILTASQQNRFSRGIMQIVTGSTTVSLSGETLTLTLPAFTAVANRNYKITYFEPSITLSSGTGNVELCVRQTSISGTRLAAAQQLAIGSESGNGTLTNVRTFTAGSVVLVATVNAANGNCYRDSEYKAQLFVEDIGPA
jgi:hypothetical protein